MTDRIATILAALGDRWPVVTGPGWAVVNGDSEALAASLPPESVDAIVTDPPSGIGFMGKEWDKDKGGRDKWIAWLAGILRGAMAALKPGGHALVWALPRTSHWTATAVEDAGFEIRDVVMHLFGSGFPKSLDVSKAIDDAAGATRPVVGKMSAPNRNNRAITMSDGWRDSPDLTAPATPAAAQWSGWGTALKPAAEHWILARKPLAGTVAANMQRFGTGGLNIDGCRIGNKVETWPKTRAHRPGYLAHPNAKGGDTVGTGAMPSGRWPAHVTLDEEAAQMLDEQSGVLQSGRLSSSYKIRDRIGQPSKGDERGRVFGDADPSCGGASRFFYTAKPARSEKDAGLDHLPLRTGGEATDREEGSAGLNNPRAGAGRGGGVRNHHPTVKPIDLMRWLCRLITPPGGVILDLFTGSGTTGVAAIREGFKFIGVEREAEFVDVAVGRLSHATCVPAQTVSPAETVDPRQMDLFGKRTA